jgi:hypothetical protein
VKVVLSNLSDNYLQSFVLRKKVDNSFLVSEIETDLIYDNKDDFRTLIEASLKGEDKETGTLTVDCDGVIEKDIHIKHSEGKYNLKQNIASKKLYLSSALDCLINEEINIFDYTGSPTKTIQGAIDYSFFANRDANNRTRDNLIHALESARDKIKEGTYLSPNFVSGLEVEIIN